MSKQMDAMASTLGGTELDRLLQDNKTQEFRLSFMLKELTTLKRIITSQDQTLQQTCQDRDDLKSALRHAIDSKFSALKAVCPAQPNSDRRYLENISGHSTVDPAALVGRLVMDASEVGSSLLCGLTSPTQEGRAATFGIDSSGARRTFSAFNDAEHQGDTSSRGLLDEVNQTRAKARSTIGLKLEGNMISDMLVGGPAHASGLLQVILSVLP